MSAMTGNAQKVASQLGTNNTDTSKVVDTQPVEVSKYISPRMTGHGDKSGLTGQEIRANYAKNARINARNTAVGSPMIDNPYRAPRRKLRTFKSGGRVSHNSGGRVKGCGIAKRGLGRAMKKGRK